MADLGSKLKRAREERGVALRDIAAATKISVAVLEALERNNYSRLPGGIFSRSFVRAYATAVGLDPESTVAEFLTEFTRSQREAERVKKKPEVTADDRAFLERQRRAVRGLRAGVIAAAVLGMSFLGYQLWVLWGPQRAPAQDAPSGVTPTAEPTTPPTPAPPPATGEQAPPAREGLSITLEFTGDCWVRITADGLSVLNALKQAGERHQVDATREVVLNVGNAGGFIWSINGRPARPLGRPGVPAQARITKENVASFLQ